MLIDTVGKATRMGGFMGRGVLASSIGAAAMAAAPTETIWLRLSPAARRRAAEAPLNGCLDARFDSFAGTLKLRLAPALKHSDRKGR